MYRTTLSGAGMYVPERVLSNDELALRVDTSDEWIRARTGIARRHIAAPEESTASMATAAARAALERAGLTGDQIDLTIVATSTPDYGFPACACAVQDAVGARGGAFDLEAACSGFVYGLSVANAFIQIGSVRHALVIGSELYSRVLDWSDRRTCILFGDGAAAAVVSRARSEGPMPYFELGSDGSGGHMLVMTSVGIAEPRTAEKPLSDGVRMNGPETFKFGVRMLCDAAESAMQHMQLGVEDVDWLVPHQANQRIIAAAAKRLGFPEHRIMSNIEEYGNTSAASIPIALAEWADRGDLRPGQTVLTVGFGAGLTWASGLMTWQD
jgi:3-oxoacyl-[acyl-carrier-protein] synthase-3